ncbi:MAG: lipopolysaccharide biosynthesis protein [bacterium]
MSEGIGTEKRKSKTRSALRWSYALTWSTKAINIVSMVILARILGPESFGVAALALVFVLFIEMFAESGLAPAIVQRKDLEPEDLDSIFWLNMALAIPLAIAGYAASDLLGHLVKDEQVPGMFAALSPLILFRGLCVVQFALAQRELRFKDLAIRGAASTAVGSVAGIGSALGGLGIWSLVVQYLVTDLLSTVLLWRLGTWRPRMRFEFRRARSFLHFSSGVIVSQVAVFASNQSDVLVMGALFGPKAVGIFRLAMRVVNILVDMLIRPVQAIALPRLSALCANPDAMRAEVLRLMRFSSLAMLPAMGALVVGAEAVTSILGPRWEAAATAMRVLAFIGVAKSMSLLTGPTMLALGRSHVVAAGSIGQCFITIAAIVCAGLWAEGRSDDVQVLSVAAARAGVFLLLVMPLQLRFLSRAAGIPATHMLRAIQPGLQALALTLAIGFGVAWICHALGLSQMAASWSSAIASGATAAVLVVRARKMKPSSTPAAPSEESNLKDASPLSASESAAPTSTSTSARTPATPPSVPSTDTGNTTV